MTLSAVKSLLTTIALTHTLILVAATGCDPLIYREGIRIKCTTGRTMRTQIDCYDEARRIPTGTMARYGCDTPFYLTTHGQEQGGVDREHVLTCNRRGRWAGGLARFQLYSCALNCGVTNLGSLSAFIIGGELTEQSSWPWHATLFAKNRGPGPEFYYICGGSLIKPHGAKEFYIVTAAHCLASGPHGGTRNPDDVVVVLGSEESTFEAMELHSPDAQKFRMKSVVIHEAYDGEGSEHQSDIGIMRLVEPVLLRTNVLPVCLDEYGGDPAVGDVGHLVGFGNYDKNILHHSLNLRHGSLPVIDPDKCSAYRRRRLNSQEFCAGTDNGQNACNGDSGGGFVFNSTDEDGRVRFYLQGIVSHGKGSWDTRPACDTFTIYTKVSSYMDWIYDTVDMFEIEDDLDEEKTRPEPIPAPAPAPQPEPAPAPVPTPAEPIPAPAPVPKPTAPVQPPAPVLMPVVKVLSNPAAEWPWHASIFEKRSSGDGYFHRCSGSLFQPPNGAKTDHRLVVLTWDGCVATGAWDSRVAKSADTFLVAFGLEKPILEGVGVSHSYSAQILKVKKVKISPPVSRDNIALLILGEATTQTPATFQPLQLTDSKILPNVGDLGHVGAFREVDGHQELHSLTYPVLDLAECEIERGGDRARQEYCAGTHAFKNLCSSDGGNGMVFNRTNAFGEATYYLEGVYRWYFVPPSSKSCHIGGYTRISVYWDWISEALREKEVIQTENNRNLLPEPIPIPAVDARGATPPPLATNKHDLSEREVFAKTVWAEARHEPEEAQRWVAWVIKNRASRKGSPWPSTIKEVCLQPWQFAAWINKNDVDISGDFSGYMRVKQLTDEVHAAPVGADPTEGADHYNRPSKEEAGWVGNVKTIRKIGNIMFYKQ